MQIRLLDRHDAPAYRALRLQALRDSPHAFSASHEDEAGRSIDEVAARIEPATDGSVCVFGLFEAGALAGFVTWGVRAQALQIDGVFHDEEHMLLRLDAMV